MCTGVLALGVEGWEETRGSEEKPPSDTELVSRMRGGDNGAYGELYRRHAHAVRRYARHCCLDPATADDLTDEVFARMLLAVRGGAGPDTAVRTHLLSTVRGVAAVWGRTAGWDLLAEDFAVFAVAAESSGSGDAFESEAHVRAMRKAERSTAVRAFRGLPERWQTVLWHTVVEGESPQKVAPLLGLTADAAAALAQRAREGLQQAYLQEHIHRARTADDDCARHAGRLGTYARGSLRMRTGRGLHRHLERCADCRSVAQGARDVCERLRILLPLAVVGWGAAVYCAAAPAPAAVSAAAVTAVSVGRAGAVGHAATEGVMDLTGITGMDGLAGNGTATFEGLGATAKSGVTAGVMAAAVATALTLALVSDDQQSRGPRPETRPSAAGAPGTARTELGAGARGSEPQTVAPTGLPGPANPAGPARGSAGRTPIMSPGTVRVPGPESGAVLPSVPEPGTGFGPGSGPGAAPGDGPSLPGSPPAPGRGAVPASPQAPPSVSTVHRLDRLSRGASAGTDRPTVRSGGSGWLWQRSRLSIGGRDRGHGVTVHARSSVTVDLNRACTAFDALVGVDDLTVGPATVRFSVYGDGVRLWRSGAVRRGEEPVPVHVSLSGRRTVRLVVEPHTLLDSAALADWAQARISCS